jgi:hypothetical protein
VNRRHGRALYLAEVAHKSRFSMTEGRGMDGCREGGREGGREGHLCLCMCARIY